MQSVEQEAAYTNFKVISMTRLGVEPKSAAPEANAIVEL